MLSLQDIEVRRDGRSVLALDALQLEAGSFTVILGHNGSGKSTLMNLLARQFPPDRGRIELDGKPLASYRQRNFAQKVAFLPQHLPDVAGLTVRELVRLGRFPWRGLLARWQPEDEHAIDQALQQTDIAHYADHLADSLSGGERQRAWVAMLLAQQAPLLLLDEPTSALDLAHQYGLMTLLRALNRETGRAIVAILHDVNLAARFADRIVALKGGRCFFDGSPDQLLSGERLSALYDVEIRLVEQPGQARKIAVVQ
ncbi:ABC transporter ATP-binding protein [Pseudomonas sp. PS1]|uniref:ABC transporter ATP-binding protein n=1 Tax=Stutzerimonas marianensis TaxID=2929513 RepID=A0A9X2AW78_9GAMM|nr:ABC transporter ATP-binding protein [Pseudomonas marianensis]MCJ0975021.1 ABC transporter ATP-binding protein [Pseudomonas marianensis]